MDNSSDSDNKDINRPKDLTFKEINDFQILLNRIWNLQHFTTKFNENIDKMFDEFKYTIKNIDSDITNAEYFDTLNNSTKLFKATLLTNNDECKEKLKYYMDILREHKFISSWEVDWIKENIPAREYSSEMLDTVRNYLSNISDFNLPCCLIGTKSCEFIENVLSSEPLFLYFTEVEEEPIEKILSEFSELQKQRFRLYKNYNLLPKGLMANIIVWDYLHLIDSNTFENEILNFLYNILRPGGLLTFNYPSVYNPEDFDLIVKHLFGCYDPFDLEEVLTNVGFEIIKHDRENQIFYVKKPGILNTSKASPTFSTVVNIDTLFDKK